MNRRMALMLTMLLGGWLPGRLGGQSPDRHRLANSRDRDFEAFSDEEFALPESGPPAADFPANDGQRWASFDIARYTSLAPNLEKPQAAIIEWIFRRTGTAVWHGEQAAALYATRSQLRAYHTPGTLKQVEEVVDRFTDALQDILTVRVRFVAAPDTRWRYTHYARLSPLGSGPQGQRIWSTALEDAAMILTQLQVQRGSTVLEDQRFEVLNGQTLTVQRFSRHNYVGSLQRDSATGVGPQPQVQQIREGVSLRISPLLTYEGNELDADLELTADTVKALIQTQVIVPRDVGPNEATVDVPEVIGSRLKTTVHWPLGQTLVIASGIHPGILQNKRGFLNTALMAPTTTELLVFLDIDTATRTARSR